MGSIGSKIREKINTKWLKSVKSRTRINNFYDENFFILCVLVGTFNIILLTQLAQKMICNQANSENMSISEK